MTLKIRATVQPNLDVNDLDMNKARIYQVIGDNVDALFGITYPFIKKIVTEHGCYTEDDLKTQIKDARMQFFVGLIGVKATPCVAVITQILVFPQKKILFVQYMGGKDMKQWQSDIVQFMDTWAKRHKLDEIWAFGRKGLTKFYSDETTSYVLLSRVIT